MVKHFNVIMAGFIGGTVALFTSVLGVSGTIIGSVLSSFLYQLLSSYSEEKIDVGTLRKPKLANEIVYIFPLVVIGIIELIFLLSALHYRFDMIFDFLESAVANNLFRLMGIGLIILGAYPYFNSNNIDKRNGTVVLIVGVLLLLRGLMDISDITSKIFYAVFAPFDSLFALFVVIALALVIFNILISSDNEYFKSNDFINKHRPRKPHARKIDTSFGRNANDDGDFNHNSNHGSNHRSNTKHNHRVKNSNHDSNRNPEVLPIYEEEVILVNNPEDPNNPIKKRILKRVKTEYDAEEDDYQDLYIIDESE
ncbi:MAG: hypothetical protein J6O99_00170 [Methanobrevibacter sp.]|nr:hypothetical protein [Methanobrevibacter sp.]MBO7241446.1 hypothetical protein [Methanobrevibacter sp.]MBO7444212.1 hypothetical protein [Methanobrevibacter sp.]MBO7692334.1 hypothetical protein [Methanobrevibacter sp.]